MPYIASVGYDAPSYFLFETPQSGLRVGAGWPDTFPDLPLVPMSDDPALPAWQGLERLLA